MSLKDAVVIGGVDMQQQARELAKRWATEPPHSDRLFPQSIATPSRPHVVIATPGRLKGLMDADDQLSTFFARSRFLVLDEADRLLEPSFEGELRCG